MGVTVPWIVIDFRKGGIGFFWKRGRCGELIDLDFFSVSPLMNIPVLELSCVFDNEQKEPDPPLSAKRRHSPVLEISNAVTKSPPQSAYRRGGKKTREGRKVRSMLGKRNKDERRCITWYICKLVGSPCTSHIWICPFCEMRNRLEENLGWKLSRNAPGGNAAIVEKWDKFFENNHAIPIGVSGRIVRIS